MSELFAISGLRLNNTQISDDEPWLARWRKECAAKLRADGIRAITAGESCASFKQGKPSAYSDALIQIGKDHFKTAKQFEDDEQ